MNLSTFWKSKYKKITIILKSGAEINFECENMTWKVSDNEIQSYQITGLNGKALNYCKISEIAAIITNP